MIQSEQINELSKALSAAQGQMSYARKDSKNPFFKSLYADLSSVWDACREPLTNNGLAVIQTFDADHSDNNIVVITTLTHSSGQWISSRLKMPLVKKDPQGLGSAITYGRRYSLAAIVGIVADEDDDGNAATHTKPERAISEPKKTTSENNAITSAQLKKIATVLSKQGVESREHRLAVVNSILAKLNLPTVESGKNLTREQASMVIDALEAPGAAEKWVMTEMDEMPGASNV